MKANSALVARLEGSKGFGFHQPRCGEVLLGCRVEEGVVVHGEEQYPHQGEGLEHREPTSVTVVGRLFFVLFFVCFRRGTALLFLVGCRWLHDGKEGLQSFLIYRRSLSFKVEC